MRFFYNKVLHDADVECRDYYYWTWDGHSDSVVVVHKDGRRRLEFIRGDCKDHWAEILPQEAALMR